MMEKRKIIGVVATQVADIEQREIMQGIISAAWEANADIAVISNIYNPEFDDDKLNAENEIYRLIESPDLCGLILIPEAFVNPSQRLLVAEYLKKRSDIPRIAVGSEMFGFDVPGLLSINTSDEADLADITSHLIKVHGFTEIDILTGADSLPISHRRVDGYRKALEENGIAFDEKHVIFGDFWFLSGERLAEEYFSGKRKLPQAVVCANDYMAYGLLDGLAAHGIAVPEKLTVIGYEYIRERHFHTPVLTTYQRNRASLGECAVRMLLRKPETGTFGSFIPPRGTLIRGNSCECGIELRDLSNELATARTKQLYEYLHLYNQLEQRLTEARSMDEFRLTFIGSEYLLRGVGTVAFCLYEHWYRDDAHDDSVTYYPIYMDKPNESVRSFSRLSVSETLRRTEHPSVYYFTPLFFGERPLGFTVLHYNTPDVFDHVFRNWSKSVSNALEFLRMKNDMQYLLECRNLSEHHDTLTGLLNKKGLSHELHLYIKQMDGDNPHILCILLKTGLFSDSLSIENKQAEISASRSIAEILRLVAKHCICARVEDSLYAVCAAYINESETKRLIERIEALLLNSPDFFGLYGTASYCICAADEEYSSVSALLGHTQMKLQTEVSAMQSRRKSEHFDKCLLARNSLYGAADSPPDAEQLCKQLSFSLGHFRRIYKELFGISFHRDAIRRRMMTAERLLLTTSLDLSAIALRCGYEDCGYFMRQFHAFSGMTANRYRKLE